MSLKDIDGVFSGMYEKVCSVFPSPLRMLLPSWTLVHFGLSSCGCIVIDKGAFTVICFSLQDMTSRAIAIAIGLTVARLISGNCNYFYNRCSVFKHSFTIKSYLQYWGLVGVNLTLSILATELITAASDAQGLAITLVNFCVDVSLFVLSYVVQHLFIFKEESSR